MKEYLTVVFTVMFLSITFSLLTVSIVSKLEPPKPPGSKQCTYCVKKKIVNGKVECKKWEYDYLTEKEEKELLVDTQYGWKERKI
jgi:hypothetical protein